MTKEYKAVSAKEQGANKAKTQSQSGGSEINKVDGNYNDSKEYFNARIKRVQNRIEELNEKIEVQKTDYIQILGVFIALFTFVSLEFQVYKIASNFYESLILTLFLAAIISLILILINIFFSENKKRCLLFIPIVLILLSGIFFWFNGDFKKNDKIKCTTVSSTKTIFNLKCEKIK